MNTGQRAFVPPAFVEAIRPDLLRQLLSDYRVPLGRLGVSLEDDLPTKRWVKSLCEALTLENPFVPLLLQARLLDVLDLTCECGRRALCEHAARLGVDLRAEGAPSASQDLAVFVYLRHPGIFRAVHTRFERCAGVWLADYRGEREQTPRGPLSVDDILRRSSALREKSAGAIRSVSVESLEREFVFQFVMDHRGRCDETTSEPTETIVYEKDTDRLRLGATNPDDLELYRAVAGTLIGGNVDYFYDEPRYSAWPLRELGAAALEVRDRGRIERVSLQRITYTDELRIAHSADAPGGSDLGDWLNTFLSSGVLRQSTIDSWAFLVSLREQFRPLKVEICFPNRLWFDRRLPLADLQQFLSTNGFLLA